MKFRVGHGALADAVAWVARELPARPVVPVLAGMRLEAGDGLALSCFDYDLAASVRLDAEVAEPGTVLVPGRLLAEITRSLPAETAEFSSDADEVSLSCGSAEFSLVALPLADYPAPPAVPPLAGVVDGGELATAIGQVLPAASRDDTLAVLTAVSVDIDGELVTLAATDRYRLAVRQLHWQPAVPGLRAVALVPARTIADAARFMTPGVPVSIALAGEAAQGASPRPAEGMISFESAGRRLAGRLVAGEFLRYESRFPAEFGCRAEMAAASFTEAVRRVSLVAERASPVRLTFGGGRVVVDARTEGRARATETVTASFHGDSPVIAFDPHHLLDGLAAAGVSVPAGEDGTTVAPIIRLQFTSPAKPALITAAMSPGETSPAGTEDGDAPERQAGGETPGGAGGVDRADASGGQGSPDTAAFRYLMVPLRPPTDG